TNTLLLTGRARERKLLLHKWLQRKGRYHLVPWLNSLSKTTGLVYNKVAIRGQRTRWGSCSSARNINLNYKLLFLQPELVDYIIIHELCHLTHFNHSADFWQLVAKFQPEHRELRKQLKRYRL
ncbi:MAG: M48 family metallopeptidase, partial [Gammaproteobacteria bacterium]|nr:M48 family metallopeptidase [Gammaproteobacteria bacterium]